MASQFNIYDWYWSVQDSSPGTQVYGTVPGAFVPLADASYVAWLAKDGGGNQPTIIDTFASLCGVINQNAAVTFVEKTQSFVVSAQLALTNPVGNFIDLTNTSNTTWSVLLPPANTPNGMPIGVPLTFRNISTGANATQCLIKMNSGAALPTNGTVLPGQSLILTLKQNNSVNGVWDVRPTGNISIAVPGPTPVPGQYARWNTPYTLEGVASSFVLGDIGAQPLDADLTSLAAAAGTNNIYYRSAIGWQSVAIGTNLTFTSGTLAVSGLREVLTAARSYYVNDGTGVDTNDGRAPGTPFKTIQKAVDVACGLDTNIYNVTINVADGTYSVTGTAVTLRTITGAGVINIQGNLTTPTNCVIAATSGFCIYAPGVRGTWNIGGFHLKALTAGFDNVLATQMSLVNLTGLRFEGLNVHIHATFGAVVIVNNGSGMSVAGNFNIHAFSDSHSTIQEVGCTYTAVGTPAIGQAWAWITQGALFITNANTYTACVCTGMRYYVAGVSYVNTGTSGNATYFPGSTAGSVASGGIYD